MHVYFGESGIILLIAILAIGVISGAVAGWAALITMRGLRRSMRGMEKSRAEIEGKLENERFALMDRLEELERRIVTVELAQDIEAGGPLELEDLEESLPQPAESELMPAALAPAAVPEAEAGPSDVRAPSEPQVGTASPRSDRPADASTPPSPEVSQQWSVWFEENVGKRWMTWAGALALFLSAAFFLKHAFENEWLGPTGRVILGIVSGIVLLIAGDYCLRKLMRALGQGLVGGGLAILYVSLFAAFQFYELIPQAPAFAAMIIVTAGGVALAILHSALPLAVLAVLGAFLSPVMVSTGKVVRDPLFAYLTVVDLGVLGTAFFRRWRLLDILAFAGTWLFFGVWFSEGRPYRHVLPGTLWLSCFYLIFLLIPFAYQLRTRAEATVERFVLALSNAVIAFCFAYLLLHRNYQFVLGFVALAMASCYLVLAVLCRSRTPGDNRSLFGFVSLSVVLLTLAVPLHLKLHGIAMAWALEGPVLVYLGYRFSYRPVRIAGAFVLCLAVGRLFSAHWPLHDVLYVPLINRAFLSAMTVPLGAAAYALVHWRFSAGATTVDRYLKIAAALLAGFLTLVIVNAELHGWLLRIAATAEPPSNHLAYCVSPVIWALGAACFLAGAIWAKSRASFYAGLIALILASALSMISFQAPIRPSYLIFLNTRFCAGIIVAALFIGYLYILKRYGNFLTDADRYAVRFVLLSAAVFPLLLLSVEVYSYCQETVRGYSKKRWLTHMSLSIVWGLYAVAALVAGFKWNIREVRIGALILLAVTGVKLVFIDMGMVQQIYRVVSFVAIGLIMIFASFLYHRLEKRLQEVTGESQ